MDIHKVITEKGVKLKKGIRVNLEVYLSSTEALIINLVLVVPPKFKNNSSIILTEEIKKSLEFEDCINPKIIPDDLCIKLKPLLLHDSESRDSFIGVCAAEKLMKLSKIHIFNDFPFATFMLEVLNFETKVKIDFNDLDGLVTLEQPDLDIIEERKDKKNDVFRKSTKDSSRIGKKHNKKRHKK